MRYSSIVLSLSLFACGETKPEDTDTGLDPVEEPSGEPSTEETGDTEDTDTQDTEETDTQDPDDADQDGDGYSVNDGDCNDLDASLNPTDADGDGQSSCDNDCNDLDATVYDGAEEICDGQSNDCQGNATQPTDIPESEVDSDGDGFAVCDNDCDDSDPNAYPGAAFNESTSACMIDADGDGYGEDLGTSNTAGCCYTFDLVDDYGDGWNGGMNIEVLADGVSVGTATVDSATPANTVESTSICISSDATVEFKFNSGSWASEISGTILDFDGSTVIGTFTGTGGSDVATQSLEYSDGMSYFDGNIFETLTAECQVATGVVESGIDCDDNNANAYPGATEVWYNGEDEDCAGDVAGDFDQDGDGQASDQYGGQDCDDQDTSVFYGNAYNEPSGCYVDSDADGYGDSNVNIPINSTMLQGDDCNDSNPQINPSAAEDTTDNIDNNCNGDIDEGFAIDTVAANINLSGGQPLTIDVDNYGFVHIAYKNGNDIEYVNNASGYWSSPMVAPTDSGATSGLHLKGVVDGLDRFHLAYTSTIGSDHDVNYMHVETISGSWSSEESITEVATGTLSSEFRVDMDVDNNNLPSIVWFDQMDDTPWLLDVSNVSSMSGVVSQLDSPCQFGACLGYTGSFITVAVDNSNTNHTAFFNSVVGIENQYNQVPNQSSSRTCNTNFITPDVSSAFIEENGDGINNDIAIKPYSNKAGVAYMDEVNADLMYAHNTTGGCGGWTYEQVDGSNNGDYLSLVYTSTDQPYIAYFAGQSADLTVAFDDGTGWIYEDVDTYGNVGKFVDMAIDSNDLVHIVYYDDSTNSIKYATGGM